MAECLVVGANGFLGSHLVDELVDLGHSVTAFDRFSSQDPAYEAPNVRQVIGNFMSTADVRAAVPGHDFVFHFVSTSTPASTENDPTLDVRTNIAAGIDLLQACVDEGVQKVFFASTGGAIYGDQDGTRFGEETLPLPVSPYAIGKLTMEGYLRYFRTKHGLDSVAFRISNPYGPRQRPNKRQGVIPIFLNRLHDGLPLTVLGDGSMVRDYLYVTDVVRMVGRTVGEPLRHSVYNIGSGSGTTLTELLAVIEEVTGVRPAVEKAPVPSTYVHEVVLDTTRYRQEFGYDGYVSLADGVAATWDRLVKEGS